ncbi:MAG: hypothetical protein ABIU63_14835 [Chitinophagaceae bacterium]
MEHTKPTRTKRQRTENIVFDVSINNNVYEVTATPFSNASGDNLYRVSYNNGPVHVFGWDEGLERYAETDPQADVIPPVVEMEISGKLNEFNLEMEEAD